MPLAALVEGLLQVPPELRVDDVTLDSRAVTPGALFLALPGATRHGIEFVPEAIARGARAVLYEGGEPAASARARSLGHGAAGNAAPYVAELAQLGRHAGTIAERFFGCPSLALEIAGVTGTNGKTTCAYLLAQALTRTGRLAGYVGTIGCGLPGALGPASLTTADAVSVQRQLAGLRALGAACVAMEVSSHALAQGRVDAVRFRLAAFTNLTRDHLDFHDNMETYGAAKARLLERSGLGARVINTDDAFGRQLAQRFAADAKVQLVLTARREEPPAIGARIVRASEVRLRPAGLELAIESSWGSAQCSLSLLGDFNADNALTVLGMLLALGTPLERAVEALAGVTGAPGRMQVLAGPAGALAIVDYAHTPDALAKALRAARAHCAGRLTVVFGCGGDRDRGKRAQMGRAAGELADEVVLTDDNPRTEDPGRIVADIRTGIGSGVRLRIEHDRASAIRLALERSGPGDVTLIAGKGHEDYQLHGHERRAFSDQAVVRALWDQPGSVEGRA